MYRSFNPHRYEHIVFPKLNQLRSAVNLGAEVRSEPRADKSPMTWQTDEWEFVAWLLDQASLDARKYRSETLQRRIAACLRTLRVADTKEARAILESNPSLKPAALNALLIGITSFFRDPTVFESLRHEIKRDCSLNCRGQSIWSAGCSDGAELYSVAIVLAELGMLDASYLLGTDCRCDAIERARAGIYDDAVASSIPLALRDRYTERYGNCRRMIEPLRRQTRWNVSNIFADFEPGLWDIIFFRNTALYFRPDLALPIWTKLEAAMKPNGLLVLGRAERPIGTHRLRAISPCIYKRIQR